MTKAQVQLTATQGLTVVQTTLAALKAFIPAIAAAGGPIGMGISAAAALIPLISQIPTGGEISEADQQALLTDVDNIVSGKAFEGSEWQQSGYEDASDEVEAARKLIADHDARLAAQPKATTGQQL